MEYAKDKVFEIRYDTKLKRLKLREESWTSKLFEKMRRHKLFTTTIVAFLIFATLNVVMISSFMRILKHF